MANERLERIRWRFRNIHVPGILVALIVITIMVAVGSGLLYVNHVTTHNRTCTVRGPAAMRVNVCVAVDGPAVPQWAFSHHAAARGEFWMEKNPGTATAFVIDRLQLFLWPKTSGPVLAENRSDGTPPWACIGGALAGDCQPSQMGRWRNDHVTGSRYFNSCGRPIAVRAVARYHLETKDRRYPTGGTYGLATDRPFYVCP